MFRDDFRGFFELEISRGKENLEMEFGRLQFQEPNDFWLKTSTADRSSAKIKKRFMQKCPKKDDKEDEEVHPFLIFSFYFS